MTAKRNTAYQQESITKPCTKKYNNAIWVSEANDGDAKENIVLEDFYVREDITVINKICNKFKEAIEHIMKQNVIAVTFHGIDSGRDGILSQMEVATECAVIVFDILNLKATRRTVTPTPRIFLKPAGDSGAGGNIRPPPTPFLYIVVHTWWMKNDRRNWWWMKQLNVKYKMDDSWIIKQ